MTIDAVISRCFSFHHDGSGTLTLDPAFQGLPDTAHGGSVLAVFDAIAAPSGPREVAGTYRRRVPLGTRLALRAWREDNRTRFELGDDHGALVDGLVGPPAPLETPAVRLAGARHPLPVSHTCFACGTKNEIGLHLALEFDHQAVAGEYLPRELFRTPDGHVAPVVLTTLLDEAAFWLGALRTGESGMTTELRVTLHRLAPFGAPLFVSGLRAGVMPHEDDPRYWRTATAVHDEHGALLASGRITFVAVRGAAKRLAAGILAMNPPDVVARVFPAYA